MIISETKKIVFGSSDTNDGETLIIKTEHSSYEGDVPAQVYFNVVNIGETNEEFNLQFYLPQSGVTSAINLEKWFKNVPYEVITAEYGDTAYLCAESWQENVDDDGVGAGIYMCEADAQSRECNSFNVDKTNCIVEGEKIGDHIDIEYRNEFKEISLVPEFLRDVSGGLFSSGVERKTIPSSFESISVTGEKHLIGPGQTFYFYAEIVQDQTVRNEFYIEAVGKNAYGLVGPTRSFIGMTTDVGLVDDEMEKGAEIHDDLLVKKDFLINDDLSFIFKYNSQKGFWSRLFAGPPKEGDFIIKKIKLKHSSREEIEIATERIVYGENNEWSVSLERYRDMLVPGKYTIKIEAQEDGQ
ncbi:MAG: hypothetical protein KAR20_23420, partial [Candidatus Heimdallarchaeota archaeon]|nr:hypothetical protein [Candidatus Heimdallarchaeota archaeon]